MANDPGTDQGRLAPYALELKRAALDTGVDLAMICGLVLRESLAGWALPYSPKGTHLGWGDSRRAFGLTQIDKRFWEVELRGLGRFDLTTVYGQAAFAANLILGARRFLSARHTAAPAWRLDLASVAAYNADLFKVDAQLEAGADPDAVTTGADYGKDVLARAAKLRRSNPDLYPPLV